LIIFQLFMPYTDIVVPFILSFLTLLSLGLLISGVRKLRNRQYIRGSNRCLVGMSGLLLGVSFFFISANLYTYHRLTSEQFVGLITIEKAGNAFEVSFKRENKSTTFLLHGDEWQIDTQVLKWKGPSYLLGLSSMYRLDRISSRYRLIQKAQTTLPDIYSLSDFEQDIDLWEWLHNNESWVPWVDAIYGNSVYMPLLDGAHFEVVMGFTGLVARQIVDK